MRRRRPLFVVARGPMRLLLWSLGAVGIVMPWGRAYIVEAWFRHPDTRRHELVHLRQVQRDGPLVFVVRYFWWCARYGYWQNPYEVEAYAAESTTRTAMRRKHGPPAA